MCGLGAERPVHSNHCEEGSEWLRLNAVSLFLKRLVSSQIIAGSALNGPSDGAFSVLDAPPPVQQTMAASPPLSGFVGRS